MPRKAHALRRSRPLGLHVSRRCPEVDGIAPAMVHSPGNASPPLRCRRHRRRRSGPDGLYARSRELRRRGRRLRVLGDVRHRGGRRLGRSFRGTLDAAGARLSGFPPAQGATAGSRDARRRQQLQPGEGLDRLHRRRPHRPHVRRRAVAHARALPRPGALRGHRRGPDVRHRPAPAGRCLRPREVRAAVPERQRGDHVPGRQMAGVALRGGHALHPGRAPGSRGLQVTPGGV
jgi:hypothetical protein